MPHASHQPPAPEPPQKRAGLSDAACRHGLIWDHTVFHVVTKLPSQSCNGGSLEAQLSDRPADRPHTQTRPRSAHRVVLLNESHDPAGAFSAYPASFKPPQPCRDPGPGRVDRLHHHAPVALSKSPRNQGTPSWLHDSTSSTRVSGVRATLIRWKPSKPTSRSHRSSDTEQQQVGPDTARGP